MVAVASTSTRPLIDRLIPGGLRSFLTTARANGDSYQEITRRLLREHDIAVTPTTIGNWCRDMEIPGPELTLVDVKGR